MIEIKPEASHQWTMFCKGRMRVEACSNCGDVHLPSNTNNQCSDNKLSESQMTKAGYYMVSEMKNNIENIA